MDAEIEAKRTDWWKVVQASDGQDVLFYMENDSKHDDCQMIHCYSRFGDYDMDMVIQGVANAKAESKFALISKETADKVRETGKFEMEQM